MAGSSLYRLADSLAPLVRSRAGDRNANVCAKAASRLFGKSGSWQKFEGDCLRFVKGARFLPDNSIGLVGRLLLFWEPTKAEWLVQ